MSERFKFRAWEKYSRIMRPWEWVHEHLNMRVFISDELEKQSDMYGYILMQFTGLLDSQGKEIFEGDIVSGRVFEYQGNFEVCFDEGAFSVKVSDEYTPCLYEGIPEKQLTVIGNIYENPDLIKP